MPLGTAPARSEKALMVGFLQKLRVKTLDTGAREEWKRPKTSASNKVAWFDVDPTLVWDLDNATFSHLSCNMSSKTRGDEGSWD